MSMKNEHLNALTAASKIVTVCLPVKGDENGLNGSVFLAPKLRGFGEGKFNGYGGHRKANESVIRAALREFYEESSATADPEDLRKVGVVQFFDGDRHAFECHMFLLLKWTGTMKESKEMGAPEEFVWADLPFDRMWAADKEWIPLVGAGKRIVAEARYHQGMKKGLEFFTWRSMKDNED